MPASVIIVAMESRTGSQIAGAAEELGYRVVAVRTVQEAVESVRREDGRIAAIFSSVALKDGNWCDLVESLKLAGCEAPFVLCTSEGSARTWWDALEHGVWEVLSPPFTIHVVERILTECRKHDGDPQ